MREHVSGIYTSFHFAIYDSFLIRCTFYASKGLLFPFSLRRSRGPASGIPVSFLSPVGIPS